MKYVQLYKKFGTFPRALQKFQNFQLHEYDIFSNEVLTRQKNYHNYLLGSLYFTMINRCYKQVDQNQIEDQLNNIIEEHQEIQIFLLLSKSIQKINFQHSYYKEIKKIQRELINNYIKNNYQNKLESYLICENDKQKQYGLLKVLVHFQGDFFDNSQNDPHIEMINLRIEKIINNYNHLVDCQLAYDILCQFIKMSTLQPIRQILYKHQTLFLTIMRVQSQHMDSLTEKQFVKSLYFVSKIDLYHLSLNMSILWWESATKYIEKNHHKFDSIMMKSILYSIGKTGIKTQKIQTIFENALQNFNQNGYNSIELFKNLIQNVSNLLITKDLSIYDHHLKFQLNKITTQEEKASFINSLISSYLRTESYTSCIWELFFKNINIILQNKKQFNVYYVIKSLQILNTNQQIKQMMNQAQQNIELLQHKDPEFFFNEFFEQTQLQIGKKFGLESQIQNTLSKLNVKYEKQAKISFMIVDFLISELNLVIEVLGPSHFIKPAQNELNLNTQFKNKCIQSLNFNLILIKYDSHEQTGVSHQLSLLRQIKQYIKQ